MILFSQRNKNFFALIFFLSFLRVCFLVRLGSLPGTQTDVEAVEIRHTCLLIRIDTRAQLDNYLTLFYYRTEQTKVVNVITWVRSCARNVCDFTIKKKCSQKFVKQKTLKLKSKSRSQDVNWTFSKC